MIGRGLAFAVAQEAALKLKETSGIQAEAFSAAEVSHGPVALVREHDPVLGFNTDDETHATTSMDPRAQPLAMIQSFYGLADAIARSRGRDPDRPAHLSKVTRTR